jgi:two-component sensor histidine kinase
MGACASITEFSDLDGDLLPEILLHTYAIDNNEGKIPIPLDDHSAWLLVLKPTLEPFFPPVQFTGKYKAVTSFSTGSGTSRNIVCLYNVKTRNDGYPELHLYDLNGHLLKRISIPDHRQGLCYSLLKQDSIDFIFLTVSDGRLIEFDTALNIGKSYEKSICKASTPFKVDLDGDQEPELVFSGSSTSPVCITRSDFSNPVPISTMTGVNNKHFQVIHKAGKPFELFIQTGDKFVTYSYFANPVYWFKYPFYLAIYLFVLGFVHLIGYLQRITMHQRYLAEQKIAGMQLLLLKNQWDPHFAYNAISVISSGIVNGNTEEANRKLMALAALMRSGVQQSNRLSRSLAEELQFLQQYVKLVGDQPGQSIAFSMKIPPEVDLEMEVPRMITQIYVENAIKHGIRPLESGGKLTIRVTPSSKRVFIEIEDNGIGRKAASEQGKHGTGKGMAIAGQTIEIFNRYNAQKIEVMIEDMMNSDGSARGTLVRISIPLGMKYDIYKS